MSDTVEKPELLLPAGSFDSAIAAMEGGADALYFGFADFSARKQARNLDRLEYRRLLRHAREKGVKLYAAINTVILEGELPELAELLAFLGRFPPDAAIVQDWGLARLLRSAYPGIAIHASTQTAVQGLAAARLAAELGASRIVLPRETPLAAMRMLSSELPGMELEAFVHGALCYSFSGLCLASGKLLGRSGNRGECAQLCRSYYDAEPSEGFAGGRGYWFSCRDLELSERVAALAEAGISSLKIEGRMKSPEFCFAVARLYRAALDGLPPEELLSRREAARTAFSRQGSEGWLLERGGAALVDAEFPGHRGALAGRFVSSGGGRALVELSSSLGLRDGILAFEGSGGAKPLQFSVSGLIDRKTGRAITSARPGDLVELDCPGSPRVGSEARRISDRRQDRKATSPEEYQPALEELTLRLSMDDEGGQARFRGELGLPSFGGPGGGGAISAIGPGELLPVEAARNPGGFLKALSLFSECGEADFRLLPVCQSASMADIFVPPSALKREKNRFYAAAAELISRAQEEYAHTSLGASLGGIQAMRDRPSIHAPPRAGLVFPREGLPSGLPFATPRSLREGLKLPEFDDASWLPLMPLVADPEAYEDLAAACARAALARGKRLVLGLGSLGHLAFARSLMAELGENSEGLSFFIDVHLYVANRLALAAFDALLPRIAFAYSYLEAQPEPSISTLPGLPPIVPIGEGFSPPLFLSSGCLLKQHVAKGRCPDECGRSWETTLADRDRRYRLIVEDCISMLFLVS
jgi:putative protease